MQPKIFNNIQAHRLVSNMLLKVVSRCCHVKELSSVPDPENEIVFSSDVLKFGVNLSLGIIC